VLVAGDAAGVTRPLIEEDGLHLIAEESVIQGGRGQREARPLRQKYGEDQHSTQSHPLPRYREHITIGVLFPCAGEATMAHRMFPRGKNGSGDFSEVLTPLESANRSAGK
jgi:hypothetical protein